MQTISTLIGIHAACASANARPVAVWKDILLTRTISTLINIHTTCASTNARPVAVWKNISPTDVIWKNTYILISSVSMINVECMLRWFEYNHEQTPTLRTRRRFLDTFHVCRTVDDQLDHSFLHAKPQAHAHTHTHTQTHTYTTTHKHNTHTHIKKTTRCNTSTSCDTSTQTKQRDAAHNVHATCASTKAKIVTFCKHADSNFNMTKPLLLKTSSTFVSAIFVCCKQWWQLWTKKCKKITSYMLFNIIRSRNVFGIAYIYNTVVYVTALQRSTTFKNSLQR